MLHTQERGTPPRSFSSFEAGQEPGHEAVGRRPPKGHPRHHPGKGEGRVRAQRLVQPMAAEDADEDGGGQNDADLREQCDVGTDATETVQERPLKAGGV